MNFTRPIMRRRPDKRTLEFNVKKTRWLTDIPPILVQGGLPPLDADIEQNGPHAPSPGKCS